MSQTISAIKCELCGSNNFVKQDDFFVCQFCGTQYTVESAKKLLICQINNPIETTIGDAEKERQINNIVTYFKTAQYSELKSTIEHLLREYPDEWRVWFYSYMFKIHNYLYNNSRHYFWSNQGSIDYLRADLFFDGLYMSNSSEANSLGFVFPAWSRENDIQKAKQFCPHNKLTLLENMYKECFSDIIDKIKRGHLTFYSYDEAKRLTHFPYAFELPDFLECLHTYIDKCEKDAQKIKNELANYASKKSILINVCGSFSCVIDCEQIKNITSYDGRSFGNVSFRDDINDNDYYISPEDFISEVKSGKKSGGCYIATYIYGSYDCPEVWRLRRFRDNFLLKTWYGKLFVNAYYIISPILVKHFGPTSWFKKTWKFIIDKIVQKLEVKGYEDTPYIDNQ